MCKGNRFWIWVSKEGGSWGIGNFIFSRINNRVGKINNISYEGSLRWGRIWVSNEEGCWGIEEIKFGRNIREDWWLSLVIKEVFSVDKFSV